jgi:hypothetical protein
MAFEEFLADVAVDHDEFDAQPNASEATDNACYPE